MESLQKCFFAALASLAIASCGSAAGTSSLPPHHTTICPDNPAQCVGACCGSQCIDTMTDPNNCGGCDVICPNGGQCSSGSCAGCGPSGNACGTGQMCCGTGGCKSLDSDVNNCGACGKVCNSGEVCQSSQCICQSGNCGMSTPDMSMSGGSCNDCSPACNTASGDKCLGNNCCLFEALIVGDCTPDPTCPGS